MCDLSCLLPQLNMIGNVLFHLDSTAFSLGLHKIYNIVNVCKCQSCAFVIVIIITLYMLLYVTIIKREDSKGHRSQVGYAPEETEAQRWETVLQKKNAVAEARLLDRPQTTPFLLDNVIFHDPRSAP